MYSAVQLRGRQNEPIVLTSQNMSEKIYALLKCYVAKRRHNVIKRSETFCNVLTTVLLLLVKVQLKARLLEVQITLLFILSRQILRLSYTDCNIGLLPGMVKSIDVY
jgi:hypothetical protein